MKPGDRIQTHPATNAWMRGDRFGTVVKVGTKKVQVLMDRSGRKIIFSFANVELIDG